jgi:hypothetical protein
MFRDDDKIVKKVNLTDPTGILPTRNTCPSRWGGKL